MSATNPYPLARSAQRQWAELSVNERCHRLLPMIDALSDRMQEFAELIHEENGKPIFEAVTHEVSASIGYARWLLTHAPRILADSSVPLSVFPHRKATLQRVPYGTVLIIGPWNVPLYIPVSGTLPALVAGNSVVLKPSEVTPKSAGILAECLAACDLPMGLFQRVEGDGKVGARLVKDKPDKVIFTGSVATGRKVMAACAKHPIPVTLELGGVDAMIVCEDADLEYASSAAAWGSTFNGGQVCASVERLIVHESVADKFTSLLVDKMERIDLDSDLGRITFAGQRSVYEAHLTDIEKRKLEVLTGGEFLGDDRSKLEPTLVTGADIVESDVWLEETFGPIVASTTFSDDDQAVKLHNTVSSGLTASVFSADKPRARAIAGQLRAGLVSINDVGATLYSQPELPWGGVGTSGFGRSHGETGLLDCTWQRVVEESRIDIFEPKRPWWYPYGERQQAIMENFGRALASDGRLGQLSSFAKAGKAAWHMLTRKPRL